MDDTFNIIFMMILIHVLFSCNYIILKFMAPE